MVIKIKDLQKNMVVIYKLNYKNGNYYIGMTNDLKRRMSEHNRDGYRTDKKPQDCDIEIIKQNGMDEVEILEFVNDISKLEEREKYWINYYDAYNSPLFYNKTSGGFGGDFGEKNSNAVFTNEQVLDIRKRRFLGERKKDVYLDYSNYSFSTFEKVWLGHGYSNIGKEYIIEANSKTRQEYSSIANDGLKNGRAKCTKEQILEMRKRYENGETFTSIHKDFSFLGWSTVRRICKNLSYKNIK